MRLFQKWVLLSDSVLSGVPRIVFWAAAWGSVCFQPPSVLFHHCKHMAFAVVNGSSDCSVAPKPAGAVSLLSSPTLSELSGCSETNKVEGKHRHYFLLWLIENMQL